MGYSAESTPVAIFTTESIYALPSKLLRCPEQYINQKSSFKAIMPSRRRT